MTPDIQVNIHRVKQPNWNPQLIPRRVTELPKTIIRQTPPKTSTTELLRLSLEGFQSLNPFQYTFTAAFQRGLPDSERKIAWYRIAIQSINFAGFGDSLKSLNLVYSTPRREHIVDADRSGYSTAQLIHSTTLAQLKVTNSFSRDRLKCVTMKSTPKDKGKSVMARSITNIVFSTEMGALDFEPSREEETFLQLIGLDRFLTRVTWEIINVSVMHEVIINLDTDTMETKLNGNIVPVFGKGWRQKMKAVFYLNTFLAKREPGTPRVHAANLFPNIKDKMRSKLGTCKINDCTVPEARKSLKFFNSLFLLRTSASTISCTAVAHIQDALNGKEVDWPSLFHEYIRAELIALKEELYKEKTSTIRTLVGPPITMMLISEGLLTIPQEIQAGILMPSELTEPPPLKRRKCEPTAQGNPQ
jgi:hypothetical protein